MQNFGGKKVPQLLQHTHSRRAVGLASVLAVVLIIALGAAVIYEVVPGVRTSVGGMAANITNTNTNTSTGTGTLAGLVAGKIQFNVQDPLAGAAGTTQAITVYPAAGTVIGGVTYSGGTASDTLTASSGSATTTQFYPPGATLYVKVSLTNYETEYLKVTSPGVTPAMQAQGTAAPVTLVEPKLPTIVMTLTDDKGNTYASNGNKINFTSSGTCTSGDNCLGENSITLTLTITNTAANTGYISTHDPLNNVNWCTLAQAVEGGTSVNKMTVSGFPTSYGAFTVGSTRYWQTTIPDGMATSGNTIQSNYFNNPACGGSATIATGGLSTQTVGTTHVGGTTSFSFVIGKGSLAHGNTLTLTVNLYSYGDPAYAAQNSGTPSPSDVALGSSFIINIAA